MAARIIIVGAGVGGLALAHALVRRGFAVEVFDRGPIPNPLASSHDEHRIIRHAYGDQRGYGLMMPAAFAAWHRLLADIGISGFRETGAVYALRGDIGFARDSAAVMARTGAVFRPLSLDDLSERAPMLRRDGVAAAFETVGDGVLYNTRILAGLVHRLAGLGVVFRPRLPVDDIDPEAGAVVAGGRRFEADRVVTAAGPWTPRLLPTLAGDVRPSRQVVAYLAPPARLAAAWSRSPVLASFGGGSDIYAVPPGEGTRLKIGDHAFTLDGDPEDDRSVSPDDLDRLLAGAESVLDGFPGYTVLEARTCFYSVRDADRFLARRLGARGHVLSACSGHGFKFAALVGEALASAIAGERDDADVERFVAGQAPASSTTDIARDPSA